MHKVLVSACLLGQAVRYDGRGNKQQHPVLQQWLQQQRVIALCPEVAGGLSVPRLPAEMQGERVMNIQGQDVTAAFVHGAEQALSLCHQHSIRIAVLKEGSPSCGVSYIYDGSFSHCKTPGQGVTSGLLRQHGVQVFSEKQWDLARQALFHMT